MVNYYLKFKSNEAMNSKNDSELSLINKGNSAKSLLHYIVYLKLNIK